MPLARLVGAPMRADARVSGFVRDAVLIIPAIVGDAVRELLIALAVGSGGAERCFRPGLRRRVGLLEAAERNVGFEMLRPRGSHRFARRRGRRRSTESGGCFAMM